MIEEVGIVIAIIVLGVLGIIKLDSQAKKHRAKKQVEAARARVAYEEALFKRNMESLWQNPNEEICEHCNHSMSDHGSEGRCYFVDRSKNPVVRCHCEGRPKKNESA